MQNIIFCRSYIGCQPNCTQAEVQFDDKYYRVYSMLSPDLLLIIVQEKGVLSFPQTMGFTKNILKQVLSTQMVQLHGSLVLHGM